MKLHSVNRVNTTTRFVHSLHGSVAMSLRCGENRNDHFVANFMLSLAVKEF